MNETIILEQTKTSWIYNLQSQVQVSRMHINPVINFNSLDQYIPD